MSQSNVMLEALQDASERKAERRAEQEAAVLRRHRMGAEVAAIARAVGCGEKLVRHILRQHGLTPHRTK